MICHRLTIFVHIVQLWSFYLSHQINYWMDGEEDPLIRFIRYPGQVESGLIIGLSSDTAYWTNVQVYNSAGLGPPSENFINEVPYAGIRLNNIILLD